MVRQIVSISEHLEPGFLIHEVKVTPGRFDNVARRTRRRNRIALMASNLFEAKQDRLTRRSGNRYPVGIHCVRNPQDNHSHPEAPLYCYAQKLAVKIRRSHKKAAAVMTLFQLARTNSESRKKSLDMVCHLEGIPDGVHDVGHLGGVTQQERLGACLLSRIVQRVVRTVSHG